LREDALNLREEKTTLEGMTQSRDELIMEMDKEYGLNHMGDNDDDEDDDDELNVVAPLHLRLLPCLKRSSKKKPPWRMVHRSWMIWTTCMMIQMKAALTWMSGFLNMGVMIEIEPSSLSI
jgi:hypothetical protein